MKKKIALAALIVLAGLRVGYAQDLASLNSADRPAMRVGIGVVCDTEGQIERYASLVGANNSGEALQMVNDEAKNPLACGKVVVAYKINKEVGNIRNGKGMFQIIEIEVVAASANGGWQMISPATRQYIAVHQTEA